MASRSWLLAIGGVKLKKIVSVILTVAIILSSVSIEAEAASLPKVSKALLVEEEKRN